VPAATPALEPGQVRDACAPALAGLVREAGGEPVLRGIVPDDAGALERVLAAAVAEDDMVVVSAGSSVGARDLTATVAARLGEVVCHGLAVRPGKPTLLADCGGVPLVGLPGNPRSALVVFRLVGIPLVRAVAGISAPPATPSLRARLARDVPSAAGRLDVVQATVDDGVATPLFGSSALLGPMARADGWFCVPEADTGMGEGAEVAVFLYG
jgi:molybdopterin molybdotransferase